MLHSSGQLDDVEVEQVNVHLKKVTIITNINE